MISHYLSDPYTIAISHSSQCSTTGVKKAVVCVILWDDAYKRTLAANWKE